MEKIKNIKLPNGEVYELGGSGGGGLPMFTSIWSDHLLNEASYLRADTFSWHSADIYITGYNIIEAEYDNENCIEETENGVTYRRSPNGFKIADASQHDNVLSAYNSTGIAWFYIIDKANRRFKLPRTKYGFTGVRDKVGADVEAGLPTLTTNSTGAHTHTRGTMNITGVLYSVRGSDGTSSSEGALYNTAGANNGANSSANASCKDIRFDASRNWTGATSSNGAHTHTITGTADTVQPPATQMYLYFYIGEYERPKAEINLGVLTELANGLDLNVIIDEITTVKNTGLEEITAASTSGLTDITTASTSGLTGITEASSTGLANVNDAAQAGVTNVNDAVGEGLTSIQTLAGSSISEIIETTDAGKAELQQIIVDKVPVATVDNVGLVKPDGDTIVIENGVIRADIDVPEVALATTSAAGIVKPDGTTITIADGVISAKAQSSSEFSSSKNTNSWLQHTPSGLMIQGGSTTSTTITFPKAFTTRCCAFTFMASDANQYLGNKVTALSKTSATVSGMGTFYWIAFGY